MDLFAWDRTHVLAQSAYIYNCVFDRHVYRLFSTFFHASSVGLARHTPPRCFIICELCAFRAVANGYVFGVHHSSFAHRTVQCACESVHQPARQWPPLFRAAVRCVDHIPQFDDQLRWILNSLGSLCLYIYIYMHEGLCCYGWLVSNNIAFDIVHERIVYISAIWIWDCVSDDQLVVRIGDYGLAFIQRSVCYASAPLPTPLTSRFLMDYV